MSFRCPDPSPVDTLSQAAPFWLSCSYYTSPLKRDGKRARRARDSRARVTPGEQSELLRRRACLLHSTRVSRMSLEVQLETYTTNAAFESGPDESELPPVDGGRAAWAFLLSGFIMECTTWGYTSSFGWWSLTSPVVSSADSPFLTRLNRCGRGVLTFHSDQRRVLTGVIKAYLSQDAVFKKSGISAITSVGTINLALLFILPAGTVLVFRRYPHRARQILWASMIVNVGSMLLSSWATEVKLVPSTRRSNPR